MALKEAAAEPTVINIANAGARIVNSISGRRLFRQSNEVIAGRVRWKGQRGGLHQALTRR